jgi:hypothetical protein
MFLNKVTCVFTALVTGLRAGMDYGLFEENLFEK